MLTMHSALDKWHRLSNVGNHIGRIGAPTTHLLTWTLTFRTPLPNTKCDVPQDSHCESDEANIAATALSELAQLEAL